MNDDAHKENIADSLRGIMEEGEVYFVHCHAGDIWVGEPDQSVLSVRHPRLYGRMLSLNAHLEHSDGGLYGLALIGVASFCVGLHLEWWNEWLIPPEIVLKLASGWFYLLLFAFTFGVLNKLVSLRQRMVYRQNRDEIIHLMREEDLDPDSLLAQMEGDQEIGRVSHFMKLDHELGRVEIRKGSWV